MLTILDYAAMDDLILLLLTSDGFGQYNDGYRSITEKHYDPEVVELLQDSPLGIPSQITVNDLKFHLNEQVNLDSLVRNREPVPSFQAERLEYHWWGRMSVDGGLISGVIKDRNHRDDGPAVISFSNFKTYHQNGVRTWFETDRWEARWYRDGTLFRELGPYLVQGDYTRATVNPDGSYVRINKGAANFKWHHPGGGSISGKDATNAIKNNQIKVNFLSMGDSVFDNHMEAMIFYSALEQNAVSA